MFDDPKEELRRLAEQLLREEEPDPDPDEDWLEDELEDAHRILGEDPEEEEETDRDWEDDSAPVRNFANGYGRMRNTDRADLDLEDYSRQVYHAPRQKGIGGLVILACLETLGIVALVAYWLLVLL